MAPEHDLDSRDEGKSLHRFAQGRNPLPRLGGRISDQIRHHVREGGSEPRDRSGGALLQRLGNERLRADKDVEAFDQVRLDAVKRRIRDLQPPKVRQLITKRVHNVDGDRVADPSLELVEVERDGSACAGSGPEVRSELGRREGEVRWADGRNSRDTELGGVLAERDRLARRLRPAMHDDVEASGGCLDEELRRAFPLVEREEEALASRPEHEDSVQAVVGEEVHVGTKGVLVQPLAVVAQGSNRRGERSSDHRPNSKLPPVSALRIERDGPVLRITLARPERRNAFDAALIAELADAFADVGDARAVVLAGDGPSFCAGADVDWQRSSIDLTFEENVEDAMRLYRMLEAVDSCPAPVVAGVQGHALGGGSGLVACADIAVAAEDAVFGFSEVRLGIIPAVISPFVLRRIGPGAARRYFLTGERFGAEVALRIGLVHEVTLDLDDAVEGIVAALLAGGPEAVRAAKRLARERPEGLDTARIAAERRTSPEGQEGLRAFLEKRDPSWKSSS